MNIHCLKSGGALKALTLMTMMSGFTLSANAAPTLIQHVATGMERNPLGAFNFTFPNPVGAGNCLIIGLQYNSSGSSFKSITDNVGNTWVVGAAVTNASYQSAILLYCLNAKAGITKVAITIGGLSSQESATQAVFSEWYNIALSGASDGFVSSSTSASPGTLTTTTPGDLIYHWGYNQSDTNTNGGGYNSTSPFIPGSGFTLLSADLQVGSCDQYTVQSGSGPIIPSFTKSGSATWGSIAIALKAANAGSPPSGLYIAHIQHTYLCGVAQSRTSPIAIQFPTSGNLIVAFFDSDDVFINSVSDSGSNTWVSAGKSSVSPPPPGDVASQIVYAQNTAPDNALHSIAFSLDGTTSSDCMVVLYDIVGAAADAFDKATTANGTQTVAGNLTTASLTPSTSGGIIISGDSNDYTSMTGCVGSECIFDSVWNNLNNNTDSGTPTSTLDEDNGRGHIFNVDTSTVNFVYTDSGGSDFVNRWSSVAAAFKASGTVAVPRAPANLRVMPSG